MSDEEEAETSSRRSRRQRSSRTEKASEALEKIKKLKGSKNKYELVEEKNVYDVVPEEEYVKLVIKRQKDDWIEDDEIGDYCEDGREIFDEEYDSGADEYEDRGPGKKRKAKMPVKRNKPGSNGAASDHDDVEDPEEAAKKARQRSLRDMFMRISEKSKKAPKLNEVQIDDDEVLNGILSNLEPDDNSPSNETPKPCQAFKLQKRTQPRIISEQGTSTRSPGNLTAAQRMRNLQQYRKTTLGIDVEVRSDKGNSIRESMLSDFDKILQEADEESDFAMLEDGFDFNGDLGAAIVKTEPNDYDEHSGDVAKVPESEEWMSGNFEDDGKSLGVTIPKEYEAELNFQPSPDGKDKYLEMYWIDLHELQYVSPGIVYVFGKIKLKSIDQYVSCCLIVKDIERRIFLLPRKHRKSDPTQMVTVKDVYNEFNKLATNCFHLKTFKSKSTSKLYAFDQEDVETKTEYLEVHVPATTNIPMDLQGDTFSKVFGSNQSSLERLLLDCKMMGPGFIKIKNPKVNSPPVSWCKIELVIDSIKNLIVDSDNETPAPPFSLISLSMKTFLNPKTRSNEIVAISALINRDFNVETGSTNTESDSEKSKDKSRMKKFDTHFIILTKPSASNIIFPIDLIKSQVSVQYKRTKVHLVDSERELINLFMAKFRQLDPDVLIGHDVVNFDLEVLLSRMIHYKINGAIWSRLGRLKRTQPPSMKKKDKMSATCGRLVVDTKISARELIRATSYDLTELTSNILRKKRKDIENFGLETFFSTRDRLFSWINLIMDDNNFIISIFFELNILPLALQITKIAGNSFSRTLLGGRSERNEFLLLHAFHDKNYIYPDKYHGSGQGNDSKVNGTNNGPYDIDLEPNEDESKAVANVSKKNKKGASYAGGLVLDPKVGYYNNFVLILDFNSLYPTIMREFNICFTTINLRDPKLKNCEDNDDEDCLPPVPPPESAEGILPAEITKLVEERGKVKKSLQQPNLTSDEKIQLDIKQKALKLTANSMYGCLGFSHSRFYAKPLAALITFKGREILMATKVLVEGLGFEVIYGDTDSIMINTKSNDYNQAIKISIQVQAAVNKQYKHLEIDCDGVLKSMLLLKKKKYAALVVSKDKNGQLTYNKEMKGLDIVRRDWSVIAKKAGEKVVHDILYSDDKAPEVIVDKIHDDLKELSTKIRNGQVDVAEFVISKQLTKNPEEYSDKKSLSHVSVAIEYNSWNKSGKKKCAGDVIQYIVVFRNEDVNCKNEPVSSDGPSNGVTSEQRPKGSLEEEIKKFNSLPSTQRAIHRDIFVEEKAKYKIDVNYYLSQQIHPVVTRLLEPIDGTDANTIAEMLGIESSHCAVKSESSEVLVLGVGEQRYDVCRSLELKCPDKSCGKPIPLRKPLDVIHLENSGGDSKKAFKLSLSRCPHCNIDFKTSQLMGNLHRQLQAVIRSHITSFYTGWMTCEDPVCKHTNRLITGPMLRRGPQCPKCRDACMKLDVTSSQLHLQFSFYEFILDFNALEAEVASKKQNQTAPEFTSSVEFNFELKQLKKHVEPLLESIKELKSRMAYNVVNLDYTFKNQLFTGFKRVA